MAAGAPSPTYSLTLHKPLTGPHGCTTEHDAQLLPLAADALIAPSEGLGFPVPDHRADLLRSALRLLAEVQQSPPSGRVSVTVRMDGHKLTFFSRPGEFGATAGSLTSRQQTILETFRNGETLQAKQISARTGYRNNSGFRASLAELVQLGQLTATDDGYRRA